MTKGPIGGAMTSASSAPIIWYFLDHDIHFALLCSSVLRIDVSEQWLFLMLIC